MTEAGPFSRTGNFGVAPSKVGWVLGAAGDKRLWLGLVFNACFYGGMVLLNSAILSFIRFPAKFPSQPPAPTEGIKLNDAIQSLGTPFGRLNTTFLPR